MKRLGLWAGWTLYCAPQVWLVLSIIGAVPATFAALFCIGAGCWLDRVYIGEVELP